MIERVHDGGSEGPATPSVGLRGERPGTRKDSGGEALGSLALCLHGARVGEIVQLRKQDVRLRDDGVWIINITPEAGTVKDKEAREVVLHPHLAELGFVDFVRGSKPGYLFINAVVGKDIRGVWRAIKNRLTVGCRENWTLMRGFEEAWGRHFSKNRSHPAIPIPSTYRSLRKLFALGQLYREKFRHTVFNNSLIRIQLLLRRLKARGDYLFTVGQAFLQELRTALRDDHRRGPYRSIDWLSLGPERAPVSMPRRTGIEAARHQRG